MTDSYQTLATPAEGYYMDRGSKFLAYVFPVQDEADSQEHLQRLRKEHPKARHFCTALRLRPDASLERSGDDGEPSGSAGKPMLGQLVRWNLTQVLAVVVRYFGGTKLGVPGLIEAYKTATANALDSASVITRHVVRKARIRMDYDRYVHFLNYCKQHDIPVMEESFDTHATVVIGLPWTTAEEDLTDHLHRFTQKDFTLLQEYLADSQMTLDWLPDPHIA